MKVLEYKSKNGFRYHIVHINRNSYFVWDFTKIIKEEHLDPTPMGKNFYYRVYGYDFELVPGRTDAVKLKKIK